MVAAKFDGFVARETSALPESIADLHDSTNWPQLPEFHLFYLLFEF